MHAVEKLAEWVDALGSPGDHTQRWRTSSDAGRRSSKRCKKVRICNHVGKNMRRAITLEMDWPREQLDWWVAWSGHSRMNLGSTASCRYHQNQRPMLRKEVTPTLLNLDTVVSDGTVQFDWCSGNESGIGWVH